MWTREVPADLRGFITPERLGDLPQPIELFFDKNIIPRSDVTFDGPELTIRKTSDEAIDQARAILAVRYRELYVPTFADSSNVISGYAGRGLEIVLLAIRPDKQLPVRTGYAPFFFRNGVPVGYGDLYLHDGRAQVSFNIFPAFRNTHPSSRRASPL